MNMQKYMEPIIEAGLLFIPIAALFTLPFMIWQYRRYGSIPVVRVLVIYSFLLYMMCAYLLTVLPLPDWQAVAARDPAPVQLIPFETYAVMFREAGFTLSKPMSFLAAENWNALVHSSNLFEILANIVMQIPLGVYLRYYFRRNFRQVLMIGLAVSLFFELTQLSGLYCIYPHAYRLCSVDDLMDNTLGALIGYWIAPILCALLPTREHMDRMSIERARKITLIRRFTSAVIDWVILSVVLSLVFTLVPSDSGTALSLMSFGYPVYIVLVFVCLQRVTGGRTAGKALLHIAVADRDSGKTPGIGRLLIRYGLIYVIMPLSAMILFMFAAAGFMMIFLSGNPAVRIVGFILEILLLTGCASFLTVVLHRYHELPHSYLSQTYIIDLRKQKPEERGSL